MNISANDAMTPLRPHSGNAVKDFVNGNNYPFLSYFGSRRSLACAGANTLENQSWRVFETRRKRQMTMGAALAHGTTMGYVSDPFRTEDKGF